MFIAFSAECKLSASFLECTQCQMLSDLAVFTSNRECVKHSVWCGNKCKAKRGPRPALFHHLCYEKYCKEILKKNLHDEENCTRCMDCKGPQTVDAAGPSGSVPPLAGAAQPPKRGGHKGKIGYPVPATVGCEEARLPSHLHTCISSNIIIYHSISWAHVCVLVYVYHDVSCDIMFHDIT